MVAAPLLDSSSGWACTAISRSCSPGALTPELSPDLTRDPLLAWVAASIQRIWGHSHSVSAVVGAAVTETGEATVTWLTQDAFDRLKSEYDYLSGPGRTEISKKIGAAREEGDLRENGGYHAAKEEQGKREARIRQLRQLLESARVGEAPMDAGGVGRGMVVTVRFAGDSDTERFLIGSREDSASGDLEIYSAQSPLGKALTGKQRNETATYTLPNGRDMSVEVIDVEPYTG